MLFCQVLCYAGQKPEIALKELKVECVKQNIYTTTISYNKIHTVIKIKKRKLQVKATEKLELKFQGCV